jgi:hypothetical protein
MKSLGWVAMVVMASLSVATLDVSLAVAEVREQTVLDCGDTPSKPLKLVRNFSRSIKYKPLTLNRVRAAVKKSPAVPCPPTKKVVKATPIPKPQLKAAEVVSATPTAPVAAIDPIVQPSSRLGAEPSSPDSRAQSYATVLSPVQTVGSSSGGTYWGGASGMVSGLYPSVGYILVPTPSYVTYVPDHRDFVTPPTRSWDRVHEGYRENPRPPTATVPVSSSLSLVVLVLAFFTLTAFGRPFFRINHDQNAR